MRTIIFGVTKNAVEVTVNRRRRGSATSIAEMRPLLASLKITENDVVMFSSSMDFPNEYTKNRRVLALVRRMQRTRS